MQCEGRGCAVISNLEYSWDDSYRGEGISRGLSRGLLVASDGVNLTGEGMGIGAIALKGPGITCFARSCRTTEVCPGVVRKAFVVDTRLLWGRRDTPSEPITGFLEQTVDWYMNRSTLQVLLAPGSAWKRLFGLKPFLQPVAPPARAMVTYTIRGDDIGVNWVISSPSDRRYTSVFLMNELAADAFTHGFFEGRQTPPPGGWARHVPGHKLYDPVRRIRFSCSLEAAGTPCEGTTWWGREHTKTLRWAGFIIELPCRGTSPATITCSYTVSFAVEPESGGGLGA